MTENRGYGLRLGELAEPLEKRAEKEGLKKSKIIRRALRIYLEDRKIENLDRFLSELNRLRSDLGPIGGNLNQIARFFNTHNTLDHHELSQAHDDLRKEFHEVMVFLKEVNRELIKKSP